MTITLAEMKSFLRLDHDADDALIEDSLISAAYLIADFHTGQVIADMDPVPADITLAVKIIAANLYDHMGNGPQSIPDTAVDLLRPYRVWSF